MDTDNTPVAAARADAITSCTFLWDNEGLSYVEDILHVETRIVETEIQVRFSMGMDW